MNLNEITKKAEDIDRSNQIYWNNSVLYPIIKLSIDARGKWGELLISSALHSINANIMTDISDKNKHEDGRSYDLSLNGNTLEIKTAYMSKSSCQHENIYKNPLNGSEYVIFVDIVKNGIYITVLPSSLIPFDGYNSIFTRKKCTLRQGREDGYKFDFSNRTLRTLIDKGYCKFFEIDENNYYDSSNILSQIGGFINGKIK